MLILICQCQDLQMVFEMFLINNHDNVAQKLKKWQVYIKTKLS